MLDFVDQEFEDECSRRAKQSRDQCQYDHELLFAQVLFPPRENLVKYLFAFVHVSNSFSCQHGLDSKSHYLEV